MCSLSGNIRRNLWKGQEDQNVCTALGLETFSRLPSHLCPCPGLYMMPVPGPDTPGSSLNGLGSRRQREKICSNLTIASLLSSPLHPQSCLCPDPWSLWVIQLKGLRRCHYVKVVDEKLPWVCQGSVIPRLLIRGGVRGEKPV